MTAELKSEGAEVLEPPHSPNKEATMAIGDPINEKQQAEEEKSSTSSEEQEENSQPEPDEPISDSAKIAEETNFLSNFKDTETKALADLKSKLEQAIVENGEEEISLWGVPLLPSKNSDGLNALLLKFLRARDFKAQESFEMLRNTLKWRKEEKIYCIADEAELCNADYAAACCMDGRDREGHPVCYNLSAVFRDDEMCKKAFGSEEGRRKFLRWRVQMMEKGIQELDLRKPGGVSKLLQVTDLKNSVGPSKKELRDTMRLAVQLLQDNYPEFVARNIFVNVPFWYYAFNAILTPFLTQRTKSKFVFARPAQVTETLLKYIAAEAIPVRYGGFKRENDAEFSIEDSVSEVMIKSSSTETIEIPVTEEGSTLIWDVSVLGWDVNYKEEFVPDDEGSYTIIIQKEKKMTPQEETVRNSYRNNEPGKIVLTIDNKTFKKKKAMYRYRTKEL